MAGVIHIRRAGELKALCGVIATRRWAGPKKATCVRCKAIADKSPYYHRPDINAAEIIERAGERRD